MLFYTWGLHLLGDAGEPYRGGFSSLKASWHRY
ncbi:hypothetical protein T11_8991 [Trichinella zimbabwensis]|uniref:Uncharacterized protein n=1 Tax=Trichinella zimbabwensis TaxID=268475 RepID=A0A0V1GDT1_9BILA|nr:hypothetical protein T11_8991 [Trichinella zimbabwensis]